MAGILWDNWMADKGTFAAYDNDSVYTYYYLRESIHGPSCSLLGQTKLPFGSKPLMMYNGEVSQSVSQSSSLAHLPFSFPELILFLSSPPPHFYSTSAPPIPSPVPPQVTLLLQNGKTSSLPLASHVFVERIQDLPPLEVIEVVHKCIALSRFKDAWHYSLQVSPDRIF